MARPYGRARAPRSGSVPFGAALWLAGAAGLRPRWPGGAARARGAVGLAVEQCRAAHAPSLLDKLGLAVARADAVDGVVAHRVVALGDLSRHRCAHRLRRALVDE